MNKVEKQFLKLKAKANKVKQERREGKFPVECATCKNIITGIKDFKDPLSWKEFNISGMCQACQNKVFK